jgi:hypothetical protein
MRAVAVALCGLALLASSASAAVWDRYPHLTCQYREAQFCGFNLSNCEARDGSAVIEFDFARKQVHSIANAKVATIVATSIGPLPDESAAYTNDGYLYSFIKVTKGAVAMDADTVDGFAQSPSANSAFTAHMVCHP